MINDVAISEKKILAIIRSLDPNKARAWGQRIHMNDASLVTLLKIIFINCFRNSVFPEVWKCANAVPADKKNEKI